MSEQLKYYAALAYAAALCLLSLFLIIGPLLAMRQRTKEDEEELAKYGAPEPGEAVLRDSNLAEAITRLLRLIRRLIRRIL